LERIRNKASFVADGITIPLGNKNIELFQPIKLELLYPDYEKGVFPIV